ncbi:MAG: tetratricopeptide repeat protein [Candidatus Nitronauta litoralis]|uniref:Tetratricopeptide repeat protein n=1 Tax=Candidatus Nitronauta litoralis TaxID=2705533 RepID=A0A7T0BWS2_9BACT|nr:MAG: tetratricopeptide repeat protein [Candidatus Nitronauta litoralis]
MSARHNLAGVFLFSCLLFFAVIFIGAPLPSSASVTVTTPIKSGIENYKKGLFSKAIRDLQSGLLESASPPAEAYYYLGASLNKVGKFGEAIEAFKKALEINPDYSQVYMDLGIAHHNRKNYSEALSSFNKVIYADPGNGAALFFQGLALQGLKKVDQAINSFNMAGSMDPDFEQLAKFNIGLLRYKAKQYEEAKAQFEACIQTNPESNTANSAREFLSLIESQKPPKPWRVALRAGASIDDNVTLTDLNLTTGVGDLLTFYSFSGSYQFEPIETFTLDTGYDFFTSIYDNLHQFDMQIHSGFVNATKSFEDVDLKMGYTFNYIKLDEIDFEYIHTFNSGVSFTLKDWWYVDLSYFLSSKIFVSAPARDGHNHSLRISNYFTLNDDGGLAWISYAPEADVTRDPQVTYVAQNISVGAVHPVPCLEKLKTKIRASYNFTYQDYLFITPFIGEERIDFRNSVSFEIIQPVMDYFDIIFQYQYMNSASNFLANDYVQNVFSLSAGASF